MVAMVAWTWVPWAVSAGLRRAGLCATAGVCRFSQMVFADRDRPQSDWHVAMLSSKVALKVLE